jgi:putative flippase GtrA
MPSAETLSPRVLDMWRLVGRELSGFGVVGAVCFCIDLGLFQVLYAHAGVGAVLARLVSTVVATTVAYIGNRYWSFSRRARTGVRREYLLFALINGVTLMLSLAVVAFVRHGLDQSSTLVLQIANVGSIAIGTVIRFVGYRQWVFPATPEQPGPPPHDVTSVIPQSESRSAA